MDWKTQYYKTINSSQIDPYGKCNLNQNQRPRRTNMILKKSGRQLTYYKATGGQTWIEKQTKDTDQQRDSYLYGYI